MAGDTGPEGRNAGEFDLDQALGLALKMRRMGLGLSLDNVCDRINSRTSLGWTGGTISKIESGGRRIRVGELAVLCWALETTAADLLDSPWPLSPPLQGWTGADIAASLTRVETAVALDPDALEEARRARVEAELRSAVTRALRTDLGAGNEPDAETLEGVVFRLYGQSIVDERDHRADGRWWRYESEGVGLPESARSAFRADATREITSELLDALRGDGE